MSLHEADRSLFLPCPNCTLHFLDERRQILMSYGFADIYRWGGSSVQFSLIIWNADTQDTFEMILSTFQAADMAALILDFINAIMASTQQ